MAQHVTICDAARSTARWTWDRLREARLFDQQLKEESITDFLLIELQKRAKGKLIVKTYTRREESRTGSDWDWWIIGAKGWCIGIRVQAKVISFKNNQYEQLFYCGKNGIHQLDSLVASAGRDNLWPAYCLYTHWTDDLIPQLNKGIRNPGRCKTDYGVAILGTDKVRELKAQNEEKSLKKLIGAMRPLRDLFCPLPPDRSQDLAETIGRNISRIYSSSSQNRANDSRSPYLRDHVPAYVDRLNRLRPGELDDDQLLPDGGDRTTIISEVEQDLSRRTGVPR
jgi:hypothetical protein